MPLHDVLLVLVGAALHATWNALLRSSSNNVADTMPVLLGMGFWAACIIPFVSVPAPASWPYVVSSILIHVVYFSLIIVAYRDAELSLAYPIMRGTAPAFSAILAASLLNESPSLTGWIGVLLICCGVVVLSLDSCRSGSMRRISLFIALSNAGVIVAYTLVDGVGVRLSGNALGYLGWTFFLPTVPLLIVLFFQRSGATATHIRHNVTRGMVGGACILGSYGIALWVITHTPIALVAALRETSVLFAMIIAALFLHEKINHWRFLSIVAISAGAVAIKIS